MAVKLMVLIGATLMIVAAALSQPSAHKGPVFTKDGSLVLPTGFRKWTFIGGPITPNGLNNGEAPFPEFHNVYIEPENFRYYQMHGEFPEGTVMVKELTLAQKGSYPDGSIDSASGRGYFPGALNGLDVMVKDSTRFAKTRKWGFFSFGHHAQPYDATAKELSAAECASCHVAHVAKTDMVWVQYYTLLREKLE
jgi:hypothetical protein